MEVKLTNIDDIRPYDRNPRVNDDAVDAVAASLREFGFRQPIVVDEGGVIICGHTRHKAALKLGLKQVPVHVAKDLTPDQVRAYRLADNKTAELAEWNMELLPLELKDLQAADFDLDLLGFSADDLAKMLNPDGTPGLTDPDDVPAPPPATGPSASKAWTWPSGARRTRRTRSSGPRTDIVVSIFKTYLHDNIDAIIEEAVAEARKLVRSNRGELRKVRDQIAAVDVELRRLAERLVDPDLSEPATKRLLSKQVAEKAAKRERLEARRAELADDANDNTDRLANAVRQAVAEMKQSLVRVASDSELNQLVRDFIGEIVVEADGSLRPKDTVPR